MDVGLGGCGDDTFSAYSPRQYVWVGVVIRPDVAGDCSGARAVSADGGDGQETVLQEAS